MYLVQITITDIDADKIVKTESLTCEQISENHSSGGFIVEGGPKRPVAATGRGGWPAGGGGGAANWGPTVHAGMKLWNAVKQASAAQPGEGCCGAERSADDDTAVPTADESSTTTEDSAQGDAK